MLPEVFLCVSTEASRYSLLQRKRVEDSSKVKNTKLFGISLWLFMDINCI